MSQPYFSQPYFPLPDGGYAKLDGLKYVDWERGRAVWSTVTGNLWNHVPIMDTLCHALALFYAEGESVTTSRSVAS